MPKKEPKKEPRKGTDMAVVPSAEAAPIVLGSADSLISQAIAIGSNMDTIERLMALRKEMQAEEAKRAFNAAMAAFQDECPMIEKTKGVKTKGGTEAYKYAPIESIVSQVKSYIKKHGFRYSTTMVLNDGKVKVTCRVVHELGHEEVSEMEVPLGDGTQIMSKPQVVAASATFAKRYAFLNAFGIMTGDDDSDTSEGRKDQPADPSPPAVQQAPAKAQPSPLPQNTNASPTQAVPPVSPAQKGPKYEPKFDQGLKDLKGNMPSGKQIGMLQGRWHEYMDKCGVTDKDEIHKKLDQLIPWSFKRWAAEMPSIPQGLNDLTKRQVSYLIDFIPTLAVKTALAAPSPAAKAEEAQKIEELRKEEGVQPPKIIDVEVAPSKPLEVPPALAKKADPPKPAPPTMEDIEGLHEMLKSASTANELEGYWSVILDMKKQEQLLGQYVKLHQTYMKCRVELKKFPDAPAPNA